MSVCRVLGGDIGMSNTKYQVQSVGSEIGKKQSVRVFVFEHEGVSESVNKYQ